MVNSVELSFDVLRGNEIAVLKMSEVQLDARLKAILKRCFIDGG